MLIIFIESHYKLYFFLILQEMKKVLAFLHSRKERVKQSFALSLLLMLQALKGKRSV